MPGWRAHSGPSAPSGRRIVTELKDKAPPALCGPRSRGRAGSPAMSRNGAPPHRLLQMRGVGFGQSGYGQPQAARPQSRPRGAQAGDVETPASLIR